MVEDNRKGEGEGSSGGDSVGSSGGEVVVVAAAPVMESHHASREVLPGVVA